MTGSRDPHDWRTHGVRIARADELDRKHAADAGMSRAAAITGARRRGEALGRDGRDQPAAKTGAHHHGPVESVIYVVRSRSS